MVIIAALVLVFVGFPLIVGMLRGAMVLLEVVGWIIRSLWHLYRAVNRPSPAEPPKTRSATSTSTRRSVDPAARRRREMEAFWTSQGHGVGVVNTTTGEVYEPGSAEND
jgi:hypothetical protein